MFKCVGNTLSGWYYHIHVDVHTYVCKQVGFVDRLFGVIIYTYNIQTSAIIAFAILSHNEYYFGWTATVFLHYQQTYPLACRLLSTMYKQLTHWDQPFFPSCKGCTHFRGETTYVYLCI